MGNIKYNYIPFGKATIIGRRHQRDVDPPGMVDIKNFLPSRSDNTLALRPDWLTHGATIYGMSGLISLPGTSDIRDVLNSAVGLYGGSQVVYFTTYIPYGSDNGVLKILSDTFSGGKVAAKADQPIVTGTGTTFNKDVYRGMIMQVEAIGNTATGSPHLFTESSTTGEYYLTEADGTELEMYGTELYSLNDVTSETVYKYQAPGTAFNYFECGKGDDDAIGWDALYVRAGGDDPADLTKGTNRFLGPVDIVTDVSGSNFKWKASSGGGANEYILLTKAGAVPSFIPDQVDFSTTTSGYIFTKNKVGQEVRETWLGSAAVYAADSGVVEALADGEWGIGSAVGDNGDLGGENTIYIRNNVDAPDVDRSARFPYAASLYGSTDINTAPYTWTASAIGNNVYYLLKSAGDPDLPIASTDLNVIHYQLPGDPSSTALFRDTSSYKYDNWMRVNRWWYGDRDADGLGYDTVYFRPGTGFDGGGDPDAASYSLFYVAASDFYGSYYSWVASANGTNEYHLAKQDGTDLAGATDEPVTVTIGGSTSGYAAPRGTLSSLNDGEWSFGSGAGDSTPNTIYIRSNAGDPDALELPVHLHYKQNIYASGYKWTVSGTATEYYVTTLAGTTTGLASPARVFVNDIEFTSGTPGSLTANEYGYGDNDALGFSTIYVYIASDPDGAVGTGKLDETTPTKIITKSTEDDYSYYLVDRVAGDNELTIFGDVVDTFAEVEPTFYYNHNPFTANYKLNIQGYTNGLIYCSPTIRDGAAEEDISGPFYAGLTKGTWTYGAKVWSDDVSVAGVNMDRQYSMATNDTNYLQIFSTIDSKGDTGQPSADSTASTYSINQSDAWTTAAIPNPSDVDPGFITSKARFNSIESIGDAYLCASQNIGITNPGLVAGCHPGICVSTGSLGAAWTSGPDLSFSWADATGTFRDDTDWQAICAATDGSRIVNLLWRPDDDLVTVRYTDDSGATWSDVVIDAGGATFTGSAYSKVKYLNDQFVVTKPGGVLYGTGAALTTQLITGTTAIRDIAHNEQRIWAVIENDRTIWSSNVLGTATWTSSEPGPDLDSEDTNFLIYDKPGDRFLGTTSLTYFYSTDAEEWVYEFLSSIGPLGTVTTDTTGPVSDNTGVYWPLNENLTNIALSRFDNTLWDIDLFVPLVDDIRSSTFSVLTGYVMLMGTRELDVDTNTPISAEVPDASPAADGTLLTFEFTVANPGTGGITPGETVIRCFVTDAAGDNEQAIVLEEYQQNGVYYGNMNEVVRQGAAGGETTFATAFMRYESGICTVKFKAPLTLKASSNFSVDYEYITTGSQEWTHYPRRLRWTVPKTYNDFTGVGSGTAEAPGEGMFLDSRPVNGRIVTFETNRVGAMVPRGDVFDPWDYDIIREDFRILSNPVTVDDQCFFIGTDGLLYMTDGINLEEIGSSFDATEFDDFEEDKPIILEYSRALNALMAYYFDAGVSEHSVYFISITSGSVTRGTIPNRTTGGSLALDPAFITPVQNSSDQSVIASYHPDQGAPTVITAISLAPGEGLTGEDILDVSYWHGTIDTGEIYLVPEGEKTAIKHIILRTYCDGDESDDRPRVIIQTKSLEDDDWQTSGGADSYSSYSLSDASCIPSSEGSAAFVNLMDEGAGAGGATISVIPPCDSRYCRFYFETAGTYVLQVAGTDYTNVDAGSGKYKATFTSNSPPAGTNLYAYWDNVPEIKIKAGSFLESTESYHRVTGTTGNNSSGWLNLDHVLQSGSATENITETVPSAQMPLGDGEVKIGINKLVEGVRIRIIVIPEYNNTPNPKVVKVTGIVIGHVPQGRKILKATGS